MNQRPAEMGRNLWIENLFRPLVVALMVGCVAWSLVTLARLFFPKWNPTFLIVGCVLAALEACYSYRLLKSPRMRGVYELRFRATELLLIFILLKLGRYIGMSTADIGVDVQAWSRDLFQFFDNETVVAFVLTLMCWGAATWTASDLESTSLPPQRRDDYVSPVERLTNRFFGGGAVLLVATGITRIGITPELLNLRRPPVQGLVFNVLVYFFLGVVMIGQMRLVELRKRWRSQEVQVDDEVPRRWVRYSLSFIGLAALLAFVLPTEFTLNPLTVIGSSLSAIGTVLYFLGVLLLTILMLPFGWLFWLLSKLLPGGDDPSPPSAQLPAFEAPQVVGGDDATNWLEIVRALVFWTVVLLGVYYVVRSYLRDRPGLREAIAALKPLRALRRGWIALWHFLRGWGTRLGQVVSERVPRWQAWRSQSGESLGARLRFFRLGALSPRERVLYYYLSILRRADRQGYPRKRNQTPEEYQGTLAPHLLQAEDDIGALTQAFVEARYSHHQVASDQERRVRANWERVKRALRALRRQRDAGKGDADPHAGKLEKG